MSNYTNHLYKSKLVRITDLQFSFNQSESPTNQSPVLTKKCERPNTSQMTLSLTKTISFDNREELQQENTIKVTTDEIVTENLNKEQLIATKPSNTIPKTIQDTRDINLVKFSECDNLVKETALCEIIDTTTNVSSQGITPTIPIVLCTVSEYDPKCMEVDTENGNVVAQSTDIRTEKDANVLATAEDKCIPQEELSPTTDEYQECCPPADYQYDMSTEGEILAPGCVPPAPTPAPSIAPLAEVEVDPPEDELDTEDVESSQPTDVGETKIEVETSAKKETEGAAAVAFEKDVAETHGAETQCRNAVCPWEDE